MKWEALWRDRELFLDGLFTTVMVSFTSILLMLALGLVFGLASTSKSKILLAVSRVYVEFIQNTPLVIQVFFIYNVLPQLGLTLSVFLTGMIGVGIYHGAYMSEIVRGSIGSIPKTQFEAAHSQGFGYFGMMRYVVIPQAVKLALPPLTNLTVALIKNTSVMAMIAGGDLLYRADSWAGMNLFYIPAYVTTGVLYFLLCLPFAIAARRMESSLELIAE